jgi:hypothetical protein
LGDCSGRGDCGQEDANTGSNSAPGCKNRYDRAEDELRREMATATKKHLKQLIDELPEETAAELERLLVSLVSAPESGDWGKLAAAAFDSWFEDGEYVYPSQPDGARA